jgi:archaetidylinositol phosphate synthase
MLTVFKKEFRKRTRFLVSALHSLGLSPNQVTLLGLFFAVLSSIFYYTGKGGAYQVPVAGLLLLLSGLSDALDGALAEEYGQTTVLGGILDSTIDRLEESVVISSIILAGLCNPAWGLLALVSSLSVSYIRSRAEVEGVKMINVGIAERAERLLVLVTASLLQIVDIGVVVLAIVSTITVLQRLAHAIKVCGS